MQPPRHPGAGLVEVRHRSGGQLLAHDLDEPAQSAGSLADHTGQRAGRHARPQHVRAQLRGPVDGQVLVDQQVAHQRPHSGAVAGCRAGLGRERRGGHLPAGAAAPLRPVLDHAQAQRRQVEHLPGLDPNHHRTVKVLPAPTAPLGHMLHHLIRLGDLGQVGAGRAGLLARPTTPRATTALPGGRRRLGEPVRRRRLGGIPRVLAELAF
jgi:hypothetical protein